MSADVVDLHFIVDDAEYGWSEREIILNRYGVNRVVKGKKFHFEVQVDRELFMIEWPILRSNMVIEKRKSGMTDAEFWRSHLTLEQPLTPSLDLLVWIRLTTCLATVWCERGYSTINLMNTKMRNRLKTSLLDDLMMINHDGPIWHRTRRGGSWAA